MGFFKYAVVLLLICLAVPVVFGSHWWDSDCEFKQQLTITNNFTGNDLNGDGNNVVVTHWNASDTTELGTGCNRMHAIYGAGIDEFEEVDLNILGCGLPGLNDANVFVEVRHGIASGGTDNNVSIYYGATCPTYTRLNSMVIPTWDSDTNVFDDFEGAHLGTAVGAITYNQNFAPINGNSASAAGAGIIKYTAYNLSVGCVELWFNTDTDNESGNLFSTEQGGPNAGDCAFQLQANGQVRYTIDGGAGFVVDMSLAAVADGNNYAQACWGAGGATFRVNNVYATVASTQQCGGNGVQFTLFGDADNSQRITALIDGFRVLGKKPTASLTETALQFNLDYNAFRPTGVFGAEERDTDRLKVHFFDENTSSNLQPNVTIDGNSWTGSVGTDGILDINILGWVAKNYTIKAWDSNHGIREWNYWLEGDDKGINIKAPLVSTARGQDINFLFYAPNKTSILADANIVVKIKNTWIASIKSTDASGFITFFLNGADANYVFDINAADGNTYTYQATTVTVVQPVDEGNLSSSITDYSLLVEGLGTQSFTGLTANQNILILSETVNSYFITVDDNTEDAFYSRKYAVTTIGGQSLTLNTYLVEKAVGILTWFYVEDRSSLERLPDILVRTFKNLPGLGLIEMQSTETDGTGSANLSFVSLDEYIVRFFRLGEQIGDDIRLYPNSTEYFIKLFITTLDVNISQDDLRVEFDPLANLSMASDGNTTVTISVSSSLGTIFSIDINVMNGDTNVLAHRYADANGSTYVKDFNSMTLDSNFSVRVFVTITDTGGNTFTYSMVYGLPRGRAYNVWTFISTIGDNIGESGKLLIIIMFTLAVIGTTTKAIQLDYSATMLIALGILGFFWLIGWLSLVVFSLAVMGGVGTYLYWVR